MAYTASPQVIVARTAGVLFGLELGATDLANYSSTIGFIEASQNAFLNALYASIFGSSSIASVAAQVISGLGIPPSDTNAYNTAIAYVKAQLNASVATGTQGQTINNIISAFSNMTTDATFGAYATAFDNQVSNAVTYPPSSTVSFSNAPKVLLSFTLNTNTATSALEAAFTAASVIAATDATNTAHAITAAATALAVAKADAVITVVQATQAVADAQAAVAAATAAQNTVSTEKADASTALTAANAVQTATSSATGLTSTDITLAGTQVSTASAAVQQANIDALTTTAALAAAQAQFIAAEAALVTANTNANIYTLTTSVDNIAAALINTAVDTVYGTVDLANPKSGDASTFSFHDTIVGNGQTVVDINLQSYTSGSYTAHGHGCGKWKRQKPL